MLPCSEPLALPLRNKCQRLETGSQQPITGNFSRSTVACTPLHAIARADDHVVDYSVLINTGHIACMEGSYAHWRYSSVKSYVIRF
jgi:hypothetical protein